MVVNVWLLTEDQYIHFHLYIFILDQYRHHITCYENADIKELLLCHHLWILAEDQYNHSTTLLCSIIVCNHSLRTNIQWWLCDWYESVKCCQHLWLLLWTCISTALYVLLVFLSTHWEPIYSNRFMSCSFFTFNGYLRKIYNHCTTLFWKCKCTYNFVITSFCYS